MSEDGFEFKVEGNLELERAFSNLKYKLQRKIGIKALRKGANVIKKAAQNNVRSTSQTIADSLTVVTGKGLNVFVTPKKKKLKNGIVDAFFAQWVELGTKPHKIKNTKKGKKKVLAGNGKFFGSEINHPGTKAKPYLRPALDENAKPAVSATKKEMFRLMEKSLK